MVKLHKVCLTALTVVAVNNQSAALASDSLTLRLQAAKALKQGHYQLGLKLATQATRCDPSDFEAALIRGDCLTVIDKYSEALPEFERGFKGLSRGDFLSYYNAARCCIELRQTAKAMTYLDNSLKDSPNSDAFRLKAQLLWSAGKKSEALTNIDQAIKLEPNSFWSRNDRAMFLTALGRPQDALLDLNKMAILKPAESRTFFARAKVYTALHNQKAADADKAKADELSGAMF